ncbi:MAG TPA: flagellar basal body P-ring formation chaperone FlgA [Acidiphilium sp.]
MRKLISAIMAAAVVIEPASVHAASPVTPTLRELVSIDRPIVELRDLFQNPGAQADTVLGPGPAPGARILIGASQLAIIASRYGVDWTPKTSAATVVIERPGTPIDHSLLIATLGNALRLAGAPDHAAIRIGDTNPPMIPPGAKPEILVNRIAYDRMSGRFRAHLLISATGMNAESATITGLAEPAVQVVVAVHALTPGAVLGSSDIRLAWVPRGDVPPDAITDPTQALGMQIDRAISPGVPLSNRILVTPELIARGAMVSLTVEMPGLEVTARGVALAAGGNGSVIPVLNPTSHAIIQAVIDGPDHAHVMPGSVPTRTQTTIPYYGLASRS